MSEEFTQKLIIDLTLLQKDFEMAKAECKQNEEYIQAQAKVIENLQAEIAQLVRLRLLSYYNN